MSLSAFSICSGPLSNLGPLALPVGQEPATDSRTLKWQFPCTSLGLLARVDRFVSEPQGFYKETTWKTSSPEGWPRGTHGVWWQGQDRDVGVGSTCW